MAKYTKNCHTTLLPSITPSEWKFMRATTKAWSLRDAAKICSLSITSICRILSNFYRKGQLKFLFDMRKVNLFTLTLITPKLEIKRMPPFTFAIRDVYNMGRYTLVTALIPPPLVDKYIDCLNVEPLLIVKGYEYVRWSPFSPLSRYSLEEKVVLPIFDFESIKELYDYPVERWSKGLLAPDAYDLVLLFGRLRNPFARPLKIYREVKDKWDPSLPNVSEQVLSYHFTRHLKAMWKGNTSIVFNDMRKVPVRIFYFEGRDAPTFARILCQLPGAFTAIVDVGKALVVAQFPSSYDEYIMCEADGFKVEMPYYFVQSSTDMRGVVPLLWKYVEGTKWVFKEELYIPVLSKL